MGKIYTTDGVSIAKAVRDHLNTWENKPAVFLLEDLGKKVPSLMIQQLASAEKIRTYVNGSYIGAWNFSVLIRVSGRDTSARLDATECLRDLGEWLEATNDVGEYIHLPNLGEDKKPTRMAMVTSPSLAARYEDGEEDYQATFQLEYKVRR